MSFEGNFDVVIEGAGTERGAKVLTAPEGLYVNHHEVPYTTLLGVALRGSILLVVGTQIAMAIRGAKEGLAARAAELRVSRFRTATCSKGNESSSPLLSPSPGSPIWSASRGCRWPS